MSGTAQRFMVLFGLLLLAALVALPPMAAEPAKPAPLALLVGISNYDGTGLDSLNYAVRDVNALDVELRKHGFRTTVLPNREATKKAIEAAVQKLLDKRELGQMLLVALSGHGVQSIGEDGKEDAYFCPADTDKARGKNLLSLSALVKSLGNRGVNLVLVDACRNDPKKGFKNFQGNELNDKLPVQTAVLFSCAAGQFSLETNRMYGEKAEEGHGVFFYHVLEALRGKARDEDGKVTWYGVVNYVEGRVNERAKEWEPERARVRAKELGVALEDLEFQTPHLLNNLKRQVVLAVVPKGSLDTTRTKPKPPPDDTRTDPKPGQAREYEIADGVKMKFCWIPPGKAQLGSPEAERKAASASDDEAEEKRGAYTNKGFWLGKFAVTQEEWVAVMGGKNPSYFCKDGLGKAKVDGKDTSRFPVETVSWEDCQKFLDKLNDAAAGGALVKVFGKRGKFALPHEDEWEYACRGDKGNRQAYYFGNELNGTQANCDGNYPFGTSTMGKYLERTTKVGSYERDYPHPWGLCDMHGNIYQWCENSYNSDPKNGRVVRGGSGHDYARECRSAHRYRGDAGDRSSYVGCRLCIRLD